MLDYSDPPLRHANATPSGSDVLFYTTNDAGVKQPECRELFIGGAGDVVVIDYADNEVTYTITAVPYRLPGRFLGVKNTGTTATNIVRRW